MIIIVDRQFFIGSSKVSIIVNEVSFVGKICLQEPFMSRIAHQESLVGIKVHQKLFIGLIANQKSFMIMTAHQESIIFLYNSSSKVGIIFYQKSNLLTSIH